MEELDYSGFIIGKHHLEFETVDFKDCQRKHEDFSRRIQEKDQFLGGDSIQKRTSNAYG